MLAGEIPLPLPVDPRHADGALALDVADHLRHRIFRRYRDHHMHVVRHQMAFLDPALLLRRQTAQDLAEIRSKLAEWGFRRPLGMNTTWYLHSHREWLRLSNSSIVAQPSVCLAAHGSERHDGPPNMSNFSCLPGIAGGLPSFIYIIACLP